MICITARSIVHPGFLQTRIMSIRNLHRCSALLLLLLAQLLMSADLFELELTGAAYRLSSPTGRRLGDTR